MKITCTKILAASVAIVLGGCTTGVVKVRPDLPPAQIATLKSTQQKLDNSFYNTSFSMYAEYKDGNLKDFEEVGNYWTGYPSQLELPEGKYLLSVRCTTMNAFAYIRIPAKLDGGTTYEVSCEPSNGKLNSVSGAIRKVQ